MRIRVPLLTAATAIALTACTTVPDRNDALDRARDSFKSAQHNPQISALANDELKRAGESLQIAELAWTERKKKGTVDHLAYMTTQQVAVARETASSRASQAIIAGAAAERDRMRLELRTAEAEFAQHQLLASQQSDARKSAELAAAAADAERNREEMARNSERVNDLEAELEQLNARETERGMVVTLRDVLFDTGKATVLPGASGNMTKLAEFFKSHPESRASIEGHTDSVGAASSNYVLSQRRADAVMAALVALGVAVDQLSTRAYGADTPVSDNSTAAGRQMNRRVEIVIDRGADSVSMN